MAITENETIDDSSNEEYDSSSEQMKEGDQITLEINEEAGIQKGNHSLKLELDDLALEMGDYISEVNEKNNLDLSLKEARNLFEKEYLLSQIKRFNGNMSKVSEFTGMERTALYRKIKTLNISLNL